MPAPPPVPAPTPNPTYPHDSNNSPVVRSRDPNDKLGPSGYGNAGYLPAGGVMAYQIRFENQPSATAPAQRVTVTDTLDPNLDLSTFELTEIAFANQTLAIPAGLNHYETRLAFTVTNQTLIPLGDASAFALAPPPTNAILVEVAAHLDVPTRLLTLTLTALDPNTGWYPEDPLTGLLYPNDDTGRGDGSISYIVRANSGAASGTRIENRAQIVFDYNDPIDTPLVSNTIDSRAPTSSVAPLPAEAGPAFLVRWSGQDDSGGSGLASFDVYVTTDATNTFRWQSHTTATSAWFRGVPGSSYAFFSTARDHVGQEEPFPTVPQAVTFVPTNAPVLAGHTNLDLEVGDLVNLTNVVSGTPSGAWQFSLGWPAPPGLTVNPTNGVLRWTPSCASASTTNNISVWVTDTGNTNLVDMTGFTAVVHECVVPGLGRIVLRDGDSGRVPINLVSSVPLTNLSMTIDAPPERLTNLWVEPIIPEICNSTIAPLTNALSWMSLATCSNQWLIGTQQVAWLHFTTLSNQPSAFVNLALDNITGLQLDGTPVLNFAPQAGRVVIVAAEPLLEMLMGTNARPFLLLYGRPGFEHVIERTDSLWPPPAWTSWQQLTLTNLFTPLDAPALNQSQFYRAVR